MQEIWRAPGGNGSTDAVTSFVMGDLSEAPVDPSFAPLAVFRENYGFVPGIFRAQGVLPRLVEAEASLADAILFNDTGLSRIEKESIALAEAVAQANAYCAALHYQTLLLLGVPSPRLAALVAAPDSVSFSPALESYLALAWASFACTLSTGLGTAPDFAPPPLPSQTARTAFAREVYTSKFDEPQDSPMFDLFREQFGFIPNLFRAQASRPDVVEAQARLISVLLFPEDALTRQQKELLMLVVCASDRSEYGVALWSELLRREGIPLEVSDRIVADHRNASISDPDRQLLDFAARLAASAPEFGGEDIQRLRECHFTDHQILEAVVATALAKFMNTLQIRLGAAPDFALRPVLWPSAENNADLLAEQPRPTDECVPVDPDLETVDAVRGGNVDAFEQLIERHSRRVYRTLVGILGDPEDARDAMQDTFLKAFQHLDNFQGRSKFSTWLVSIATNTGLQRLRERKPVESLDDSPSDAGESFRPRQVRSWADDPEQLYSQAERRRLVESSVMKLPAKYRVAVVLRDLELLSTEEAAAALGLEVPALKSRLLRGRLMLREALAPHFTRRTSEVAN
jgi:RNA polymerase sigma-70 factor, ECF subfamily